MLSSQGVTSELEDLLRRVMEVIEDPRRGLPEPVFQFLLRVTPMVNVDLLVKDEMGRHLLAWREDGFGVGWHIPGGIVRWGEVLLDRINEVARLELAATVTTTKQPTLVAEAPIARGTFVSLLYVCTLHSAVADPDHRYSATETTAKPGQLHWFSDVPLTLYPHHSIYRHLLVSPHARDA